MQLDHIDKIEYTTSKEEYEHFHDGEASPLVTTGLNLTGIGPCNILVEVKGGNTAHFEIHALENDFKTCIKIYEPKYYFRDHPEFSKLTDQQVDELAEFLMSIYYGGYYYSSIEAHWRSLNGMKKYDTYDQKMPIPDYHLLKEDK